MQFSFEEPEKLTGDEVVTDMNTDIETHYGGSGDLLDQIRRGLQAAGKDIDNVTAADLATMDEFHIRGREATLELAERMELSPDCHVLDMGSGLGGPARTVADAYGCKVTGVDLTRVFCDTAGVLSDWLGLSDKVRFVHGDATDLPFESATFDAVMTIHTAMNVPAKDVFYASARRVLKPGGVFAVYDVVQGEGGPVLFPVPWARDDSTSSLATPEEMRALLAAAGFEIEDEIDSSDESLEWFRKVTARIAESGPPPVNAGFFLGDEFSRMAGNQVRNLEERRARTVTYICRA